jgi:uncharacterized protein (UPF0212 family)
MRGLFAQELLYIWEVALPQHPVDRALTILATALPEMPWDELLALSAGQRDIHLLAVRERTFGSQLAGFAECPDCQERLEFVFDVADIRAMPQIEDGTGGATKEVTEVEDGTGAAINRTPTQDVYEVKIEGYDLCFRLPNSLDLAQIVRCGDVDAARNVLVQRCVLQASQDGVGVAATALPETVLSMLAESLGQYDPQADVQLNLSCPACGQSWSVMFDVVSFFWSEICAQVKRLLREVHTLARSYGWREADILNLSTARRQFYLEMVT